ncbi:MAG TPA: (2Fe-2S)-binding protein, partial [Chloroflexota bacterium]|nr:(2Fe-2S)-binding protein [Chloroflexota bacterium]
DLEANMLPEGEWAVTAIQRECNWLQALEGDIDTSHAGLLHFGSLTPESQPAGTFSEYLLRDRAPQYAVLDTDAGTTYGAYREAQPGFRYWRIAHFLLPFYGMPPQGLLGAKIVTFARVPMDDTHTLTFNMMPKVRQGASANPASRELRNGGGTLPNSTGWHGRFRLTANATNDYELDRDLQRANRGADGFTGVRGVGLQDQAITESQGPIADRSQEHLGSSDAMVIRVRRRLLEAVHAFVDDGLIPPGVDDPTIYHVRAGGVYLPADADWVAATRDLRRAFVTHPGLDLSVTGPLAAGEFNGRTD